MSAQASRRRAPAGGAVTENACASRRTRRGRRSVPRTKPGHFGARCRRGSPRTRAVQIEPARDLSRWPRRSTRTEEPARLPEARPRWRRRVPARHRVDRPEATPIDAIAPAARESGFGSEPAPPVAPSLHAERRGTGAAGRPRPRSRARDASPRRGRREPAETTTRRRHAPSPATSKPMGAALAAAAPGNAAPPLHRNPTNVVRARGARRNRVSARSPARASSAGARLRARSPHSAARDPHTPHLPAQTPSHPDQRIRTGQPRRDIS